MYWKLANESDLPAGYILDSGNPRRDVADRLLSDAKRHNPGCILVSLRTHEWDKPTDTHPGVPPRVVTRWCVLRPQKG